jgi:hypothetical protein
VAGTDVVVDSDDQLHVTAPPHLSGIVHVRVTTPAGTSRTSWDSRFSFDTPVEPAGVTAVPAPLPGGSTAGSDIADVACPAPGECFAVGSYSISDDETRPLVERLSGGTWSPTELPLPPDAVHPPEWWQDARMQQVACTAVDFCVAAGVYDTEGAAGSPLFATWDGSGWTVFAYFVGDAVNGDDWIHFDGLDCTADRRCAAVGADLVFVNDGDTWAIAPTPDTGASHGRLNDVDCTATECFAVGRLVEPDFHHTPLVERGAGLSWTAQALPHPAGGRQGTLNAISCPAEGSCTAVGQYTAGGDRRPLVETLAGGTWTPGSAPQPSVNLPDVYAFFRGVSCPAPGSCVAVGAYEDEVREGYDVSYPMLPMTTFIGGGAPVTEPVPMVDVDPVRPEAGMDDVLCTAPGRCVGTGGYNLLGYRTRGLVATLTAGAVGSSPVRTPFQAGESFIHGSAVDTADRAVVVGQYVDAQGRYRGLLVTGVAIGP